MKKNARLVFFVALNSLAGSVRSRFFTMFAVFAFMAVYASVLAGVMAVDQEARLLMDFGLLLTELTALAYLLFEASTSLVREAETKTVYLVFSRPVPRWSYLAGKILGAVFTAALMLAVMGAIHLSLLYVRGFGIPAGYGWALLGTLLKLSIIVCFAFFVSLFSTSAVSTLVISSIMWTLGHFVAEARFMADKASGFQGMLLGGLLYLVPNLQIFRVYDASGIPCSPAPSVLLPAACWALACYMLGLRLLERKEF